MHNTHRSVNSGRSLKAPSSILSIWLWSSLRWWRVARRARVWLCRLVRRLLARSLKSDQLYEDYSFLFILDCSLTISWRKNPLNPERVSSVFTFVSVYLCVCTQITEQYLGWGILGIWERNLVGFFSTRNFCLTFLWHFLFLPYIIRLVFLKAFSSYRSYFFTGRWHLDWQDFNEGKCILEDSSFNYTINI